MFTSKQGSLRYPVLIELTIMELNCMHFRFFIDEPYTTVLHLVNCGHK